MALSDPNTLLITIESALTESLAETQIETLALIIQICQEFITLIPDATAQELISVLKTFHSNMKARNALATAAIPSGPLQ